MATVSRPCPGPVWLRRGYFEWILTIFSAPRWCQQRKSGASRGQWHVCASTGESGGSAFCSDLNPARKPKSGPNQKCVQVVFFVARSRPLCRQTISRTSDFDRIPVDRRDRIFDRILANSPEPASGRRRRSCPPRDEAATKLRYGIPGPRTGCVRPVARSSSPSP